MGVVARGTVLHHSLTGPVGDALAVGTTRPIPFLSKMTGTAHAVDMIHVYFPPFPGHQEVTIIPAVAGKAGKWPVLLTMGRNDITMGDLRCPRN